MRGMIPAAPPSGLGLRSPRRGRRARERRPSPVFETRGRPLSFGSPPSPSERRRARSPRLRDSFPRGACTPRRDRKEAAVCEMRGWDRVAACPCCRRLRGRRARRVPHRGDGRRLRRRAPVPFPSRPPRAVLVHRPSTPAEALGRVRRGAAGVPVGIGRAPTRGRERGSGCGGARRRAPRRPRRVRAGSWVLGGARRPRRRGRPQAAGSAARSLMRATFRSAGTRRGSRDALARARRRAPGARGGIVPPRDDRGAGEGVRQPRARRRAAGASTRREGGVVETAS